jgi:2-polyprenyl-6-methoxyphenol hydroxylase-like FAD-dependent oxidoreductase
MLQKVAIIGAGPTGLLLANYLLRRGQYRVELFKQRPDPCSVDLSQDRTFALSLQERGRKALRQIPKLEEAIASKSVFCNGTKVYRQQGKAREFPRTKFLAVKYFLRLKIHRFLHQFFSQCVKPFVFDLVRDYDLPYFQVLKLNQGWINKVKRSQSRPL